MRQFFRNNAFVFLAFGLWRIILTLIEAVSRSWWPFKFAYLGPTPWANFDGVHYLGIALGGYGQYQQAFFPLYPLLIRGLAFTTGAVPYVAGLIISHTSFFFGLWFFYHWAHKFGEKGARWAVIFLLAYPLSFFFAAVYSESLFFLLAAVTLYFASSKQTMLSGLSGMLASGTRIFGLLLSLAIAGEWGVVKIKQHLAKKVALLLVPLGLVAYMGYLWQTTADPLAFMHVLPKFGSNRSGGEIVWLPQTIWRYLKIFFLANKLTFTYWLAVVELLVLAGGLMLVVGGWKQRALRPALWYALTVLILPTFTGTLTSLPRYFLSAFPLFIVLGSIDNTRIKYGMLAVFIIGLIAATSLFLQGYFVS